MNLIKRPFIKEYQLFSHAKISLFKKGIHCSIFWTLIALCCLSLNFLPNHLIDPFSYGHDKRHADIALSRRKEDKEFNKQIAQRFRSTESIVYYVQKHVPNAGDKLERLELLTKLIRQRFHHAYAIYGMQENWIAVLAGRFIWRDLSAKVIPEDILEGDVAACSQVAIVLMDVCQSLDIPTRKVGLDGHFVLEAFINNQWYYMDANLKPDFNAIGGRKSLASILKNHEQYKLYANTVWDSSDITRRFSSIKYALANKHPAPKAYIFHVITKGLSHFGWIIPASIALYYFRRRIVLNQSSYRYK